MELSSIQLCILSFVVHLDLSFHREKRGSDTILSRKQLADSSDALPRDIKGIQSEITFRKEIKTYLLNIFYN